MHTAEHDFLYHQALTALWTTGLYAFAFAQVHLFLFIAVDNSFDLGMITIDVGGKCNILAGGFTLPILSLLAFNAFRYWMRRLGIIWKWIHRLVYLAGLSAGLHSSWARKGDLAALQGDVLVPAFLSMIVLFLLYVRLSGSLKHIVSLRSWLTRQHLTLHFRLPWAKIARQG